MVSNQITGNIGLYYACFHLSTIGWNVMPTARNAAGIDIVAYDGEGVAFRGIQVKTVRGRNAVPLGSTLNKVMGDFWIIVRLPKAGRPGSPQCFVMTPAEVRAGATSNRGSGSNGAYGNDSDIIDIHQSFLNQTPLLEARGVH